MIIKTNLGQPIGYLSEILRALLVSIIVVSALFSLFGWADYALLKEEVVVLQSRLERLKEKQLEISDASISRQKLAEVIQRVEEGNRLLVSGSGRLPQLLLAIEEAAPTKLALQSLHYDGRQREFVLVAEAEDSAALPDLVSNLQSQIYFSDVHLRRQRQAGTRAELVQLELGLVESRP